MLLICALGPPQVYILQAETTITVSLTIPTNSLNPWGTSMTASRPATATPACRLEVLIGVAQVMAKQVVVVGRVLLKRSTCPVCRLVLVGMPILREEVDWRRGSKQARRNRSSNMSLLVSRVQIFQCIQLYGQAEIYYRPQVAISNNKQCRWGIILVTFVLKLLPMTSRSYDDEPQTQRNKGSAINLGRIIKGTLNEAPVKLKVSSIPSKNENIIYRVRSQHAFGDSTRKFYQPGAQDQAKPGPGEYNLSAGGGRIESKKGSGFFASSTRLSRLDRVRSHVPGPGAYKVESTLKLARKHSQRSKEALSESRSTAMMSSQIQSRDPFREEVEKSKNVPGIGSYDVNPERVVKSKSAYSAFKSRIDRFAPPTQQAPPVGFYEISHDQAKSIINQTKKYSIQQKVESHEDRKRKLENAIRNLQKKQGKQALGPGSYEPIALTAKKQFKIRQTMYDRFGELKPIYMMAKAIDSQNPQIQMSRTLEQPFAKTKAITSIFKSNTKKFDITLNNINDPCAYNPSGSSPKKSHLINFAKRWV